MLDLLCLLFFIFQANFLGRWENGCGRFSTSGTLITAFEPELVPGSRSELIDEIL